MPVLGMAAGAALCFLLAVWGFALMRSAERVTREIVPRAERAKRPSGGAALSGLADALGRPFTRPLMELLGPRRATIRRRIDAAGRPGNMTVESYARQTAGYLILFGCVAALLIVAGQVMFGLLALLGAAQVELLLYSRARSRQEEIQRTLPDFLDVLAVTVTAGLSFRHALARVSASMPGPLAEEFMVTLRQMELGTPRRQAFEDLRRRNGSEALRQFVTAILQAEELGSSLSGALVDISSDVRREAAQWAKRKAQRATPRITAVTTALSLPAVMAIVLGSMFYTVGADIGGLLHH